MNYRKPAFWAVLLALIACVTVAVCFLTDPVDPAADSLETDGMQMQQVSFPYATEEGYYLLIGADGVQEIRVSLPDSGGGVINADGSSFKKGEKVWLEHLHNVTDLRGLSIAALGKNGEVLYGLSIPEDASMEEVINTIGGDGWLLAPTEHFVDPTMWHDGISFDELEPNEEMVSAFEIALNKESNSILYSITWARTGLTLEYGLRSSDGTEYCNAHAGGSGNGQFQNLPAGSYRLFVRNTDYSGVPAYEDPDAFPYISFNATGAMNYRLE